MDKKKQPKLYWLKLQESFFEDETLAWLEEHENGAEYVLFYLKLCLKALKSNNYLIRQIGGVFYPYDAKRLAKMTNTDYQTVILAMSLFEKAGLIEYLENGAIYLTELEGMVGVQTIGARIRQNQRDAQKAKLELAEQIIKDEINEVEAEIVLEEIEAKTTLEITEKETEEIEVIDAAKVIDAEIVEVPKVKKVKKEPDLNSFLDFWAIYPKKMKKEETKKWFVKNKPNEKELKEIIEGLEFYKTKVWNNPKYIPLATTFLNQKYWKDKDELIDNHQTNDFAKVSVKNYDEPFF